MMRALSFLAVCVSVTLFVWGQQQPDGSEVYNPQKLVPPAEYRHIPKPVRDLLEQRGCLLPENQNQLHPMNVVSGHFVQADQTDWASLCVVKDQARVVMLWGGKAGCSDEIHSGWPLKGKFSRQPAGGLFLAPVSAKQILAYRRFFGDEHTNEVDHQGVEVGDDQASLIYYCDGNNWLELAGND